MKKKIISLSLMAVMAMVTMMSFTACCSGEDIQKEVKVQKITFDQQAQDGLTLEPGGTATITTTVEPADATNPELEWTSSDPSVATVDENGVVTAKDDGTVTITTTATDGSGVTATCTVTVEVKVSSISLSPSTLTLTPAEESTLIATVNPANATDKSVTWTSSNTDVATVDENGKVTAVGKGTATITATAHDGSGVTATCAVTVNVQANADERYNTDKITGWE